MIDSATIQNLFSRYGWQSKVDGSRVLTGFQGTHRQFLLAALPGKTWLTLTLISYLPPLPLERRTEVCDRLLRQQANAEFVRFALLDDHQVTLVIDVPAARGRIDYDLFALMLDVIVFYADDAYPDLYTLVTGKPGAQNEPTQ